MELKDYYGILEIEPSATMQEIKRAFRKLALRYHPDTAGNNKYAAAQFEEVKEAYETLTNPSKKYLYLQERWLARSAAKKTTQHLIAPEAILKKVLELERHVATQDVFRMNKVWLKDYTLSILTDEAIQKLHDFDEPEMNNTITSSLLNSVYPLPVDHIKQIAQRLYKLAGNDQKQVDRIKSFENSHLKKYRSEKYSVLGVVVITVIICLIIWLGAK